MRSTVVVTLAAAGVLLTAGTASAQTDTIPKDGSGWTVTGDSTNPWNTTTADPWTVTATQLQSSPTSSPPAPSTRRRAGSDAAAGRRGPVSRSGPRLTIGCQPLSGGVWLVRPGDTLWRISICTRHDLGDLVTVNHLPFGGRLIFPGDRITVEQPSR